MSCRRVSYSGMHERAELSQGTFVLTTSLGCGFEFTAHLPAAAVLSAERPCGPERPERPEPKRPKRDANGKAAAPYTVSATLRYWIYDFAADA